MTPIFPPASPSAEQRLRTIALQRLQRLQRAKESRGDLAWLAVIPLSACSDDFIGTDEGETLTGNDNANHIFGGSGDDIIVGLEGNDSLDGGFGEDLIFGGDGDDLVRGQEDNDRLTGNAGNDAIYGGLGDDTLVGHTGNDAIYGQEGNDRIYADSGNDAVDGGTGYNVLYLPFAESAYDFGSPTNGYYSGSITIGDSTLVYSNISEFIYSASVPSWANQEDEYAHAENSVGTDGSLDEGSDEEDSDEKEGNSDESHDEGSDEGSDEDSTHEGDDESNDRDAETQPQEAGHAHTSACPDDCDEGTTDSAGNEGENLSNAGQMTLLDSLFGHGALTEGTMLHEGYIEPPYAAPIDSTEALWLT
ncbi:MAG: hypothetical protein K0U36_00610 [Alphaproteobacteria bacterium]|nr:hypothetical protein [Alphaproteobacteria bacterium]